MFFPFLASVVEYVDPYRTTDLRIRILPSVADKLPPAKKNSKFFAYYYWKVHFNQSSKKKYK